ncbi:MAG: PDZ domain-containing protein [Phycisphaerae bacterium]|nr:PDZ domain-containing protein [Phycisphaerae bacterium]
MNRLLILSVLAYLSVVPVTRGEEARLLRFPAIHGDQVVFTYAGDLYSVSVRGGVARQLTSHEGFEMFARFSPDGQSIAFTGQYDGNTEVYLIPATGGVPRRLTYTPTLGRDDVSDRMGPNNIVMTWTPDGQKVIFRSRMKSYNSFNGQLYATALTGGLPEELPFPRGGFCAYSPDGKRVAFNRIFREFRTWKRYRGGMADDVWIYDFDSKKTINITDDPAQDIIPMWKDDRIYFLSDRGEHRRMNLYVYDMQTQDTRPLTRFTEFDIKFPSLGDEAIVFENGGYLYRYDLAAETYDKIEVAIQQDHPTSRSRLVDVADNVRQADISPDGKRAVLGARGDVFTVPAEHGVTRNLTRTSGVHERNAVWSPDGRWIAYISDQTGEDEIWVVAQDGSKPARQVTKNAETYKYRLVWSPDSRKILWADKRLRLRYANARNGQITEVAQSEAWEFNDYAWAPDSRWIVYGRAETEGMNKIYLYSLRDKQSRELTDGWYDASDPVFGSDGKCIYFVSNRDFNPVYSRTEWNHVYQDMSRIYLITLTKDVPSPFAPLNDEVKIKDANDDSGEDKKDASKEETPKKEAETVTVKVDFDGIKDRIAVLPIEVASYGQLTSVKDDLYYVRSSRGERDRQLVRYDFKERKETELGSIGGYTVSADQKKMLVSSGGRYAIIDCPKGKVDMEKPLDLSHLEVELDRKSEWTQIYHECWRQMREYFYVPNMHGVDWEAIRDRYAPLVEHANHRADLNYIIGEMIGELNVGHAYISGGDMPHPQRIDMGLLGAKLSRHTSGYYRIDHILPGQNWHSGTRSPLTEIGVDANEGDYILAIDGTSTAEVHNLYELLINKAGRQVVLTLNGQPTRKGSREVTVIPTGDQADLYYYQWVQGNIDKVTEATDGKVGYIHVPDMGVRGLNEFVEHFYPQLRKKALIIDVRGNGGGNVSPMLIERLRREIVMIEFSRDTAPTPEPAAMIYGPLVCLADEFSASDGDLFTYQFKHYQLGKVVGKRTWGGVVGIRGSLPLLDGGDLRKPEFSRYDVTGKAWIIEGVGVEPDIEVDNDPALEYAGVDQQLNKAIEVIVEALKTQEKDIPPLPQYPVR